MKENESGLETRSAELVRNFADAPPQNGGISKASKGINLSEDIFAGYNNCLRGGGVDFKEYLQVRASPTTPP